MSEWLTITDNVPGPLGVRGSRSYRVADIRRVVVDQRDTVKSVTMLMSQGDEEVVFSYSGASDAAFAAGVHDVVMRALGLSVLVAEIVFSVSPEDKVPGMTSVMYELRVVSVPDVANPPLKPPKATKPKKPFDPV